MKDNLIKDKSYAFALRIIKLHQYLVKEKHENILSKQVLRSGTSIGANVEEAIAAQTKKDFIAKMTISQKEAYETNYWLRLLRDSNIVETKYINNLIKDIEELIKLLVSIIKTSKNNLNK